METHSSSGTLLARFRDQLKEGESSDRTFGLSLGGVLILLGLIPLIKHKPMQSAWMAAGILLGVLALAVPGVLHYPKRAWLFFGFLLGLVVNPVVLGILFLFIITPFGWLMRATGRDPLSLRLDRGLESYWRLRTGAASDMADEF